MIVGHKLSYAHEDTLNEGNVTTAIESDEDNNHENDTADIKNDDDDGSLLSVDLDDLSGSILDNLPSSHDNNDVDHSIDNHSDDHNMMAVDNTAAPAFFFEPIVQAMQELQHTTATNSNTVIVALDDDDDDADDEIVLLAPSPSMNPSVLPQRTMKQAFAGKIACLLCLMVALTTLWRISKHVVLKNNHATKSTFPVNGNSIHSATMLQQQKFQAIPVLSPSFVVLQTEQVVTEESVPVNAPTLIRVAQSIEPTIAKLLTHEMNVFGDAAFNTESIPLPEIADAWFGTMLPPPPSLSSSRQIWLPDPVVNVIAVIYAVPTYIGRLVSMMVYAATMIVTGLVLALLLVKFLLMSWKKAHSPQASSNGVTKTTNFTRRIHDKVCTPQKFTNVSTLCEFIRSAKFSRTGRRPRSPVSKTIKDAYNIECYEMLSVDDLRCIGKFFQVPKLSRLQQKSALISAVVAHYERSLQSLSASDIKEVLSAMNLDTMIKSDKKDLIKIAIEVGF